MIAWMTGTYSEIPNSLAYRWIAGVWARTSALSGSLLWELPINAAPPMIPTMRIKITNTVPPPAINAANAAFTAWAAASAIAFIPFAVACAVFLLCLAVWTERMAARFASLAALMDWNACFFCKIAWVFTF